MALLTVQLLMFVVSKHHAHIYTHYKEKKWKPPLNISNVIKAIFWNTLFTWISFRFIITYFIIHYYGNPYHDKPFPILSIVRYKLRLCWRVLYDSFISFYFFLYAEFCRNNNDFIISTQSQGRLLGSCEGEIWELRVLCWSSLSRRLDIFCATLLGNWFSYLGFFW